MVPLAVSSLVLLAAGVALMVHAEIAPHGPPQPPASAALPLPAAHPAADAKRPPMSMRASRPVRVALPRLRIDADLLSLGVDSDGSLAVPSAEQARMAAWYDGSPTPGELGTSIITGHVDSRRIPAGRAAFFYLGDARPGDVIDVSRADKSVAEFTVDSVRVVLKSQFPDDEVFGAVDYAGLRLITCGGEFTKADGYLGNVIVFAHLTSTAGKPPPPPVTDNGPVPGVVPAFPSTTPGHAYTRARATTH